MMDAHLIEKCLRADRHSRKFFLGCFPADMLPVSDCYPYCFVGNLDCAWSKGSHWVVVFVLSDSRAIYFDSLGRSPTRHFSKYLANFSHVSVNEKRVQNVLSSVCGQFCIYVVMKLCRGQKPEDIVRQLLEKKKKTRADEYVQQFVNATFGLRLPLIDIGFVLHTLI